MIQSASSRICAASDRISPQIEQEQRQARDLMQWGRKVLEASSSNGSLKDVIVDIVNACESVITHSRCSIFLVNKEGSHISDIVAPSLHKKFIDSIIGEGIGPMAGSCGTAVYKRERTVSPDIAHDPLWVVHRDIALINDIRSSWSTPIIHNGIVWGVLNIYREQLGKPNQFEKEVVDYCIGLLRNALRLRTTDKEEQAVFDYAISEDSILDKDEEKSTSVLSNSEVGYLHILKTMKDGFLLLDQKGRAIMTNKAYEKLIGYEEKEILKMNIMNLRYGLTQKQFLDRIPEVVKKGSVQRISQHCHKNGDLIDVEVTCSIMNIDGQQFIASFIRDITDKKRKEELMTRQLQALEKYAFINSHEVRAKVATMLGLMNLHKDNHIASEEREQIFEHLYKETNDLDRVIRKLSSLINDENIKL